jgi:hypothetical protein
VDVPNLCSNRFEKALLSNINNDAKTKDGLQPRRGEGDRVLAY